MYIQYMRSEGGFNTTKQSFKHNIGLVVDEMWCIYGCLYVCRIHVFPIGQNRSDGVIDTFQHVVILYV